MSNIYCIGETTYDIIFRNGQPSAGVVGGSMLNSSVSLGRLKLPVSFISRIGNDRIGNLSVDFLNRNGVSTANMARFDGNSRLALAFLDENNNAEYQFYKEIKQPPLPFPRINSGDMVLFGSTNAIDPNGRQQLLDFLHQAKKKGALLIYDPNIRETDTAKLVQVKERFEENLRYVTALKGSMDDFDRLYGTVKVKVIFEHVKAFGVQVLLITDGEKPFWLAIGNSIKQYPVQAISPVSTIGAGDNFNAGLLYGFYHYDFNSENIEQRTSDVWDKVVGYASRFSASVCQSVENYVAQTFNPEPTN